MRYPIEIQKNRLLVSWKLNHSYKRLRFLYMKYTDILQVQHRSYMFGVHHLFGFGLTCFALAY